MKKLIIIISILLLAILAIAFLPQIKNRITGQTIDASIINEHSFTTAICNDSNFCQDYEIYCKDNKVIETKPITGAVVQHDEEWQDPRQKHQIENLCNESNSTTI